MKNEADEWVFIKRPTRKALSDRDVTYWKNNLAKLLKVGVEIELNLPEKEGTCDRQNFLCECVAVFKPEKPMPETSNCYEQCQKWDNGNCSIAKEHGCAGIYCVAFEAPCPKCSKYDRGCDSCPQLYDLRKDPRYIRQAVGKVLQPTKFVGSLGPSGVYKVCKDGSLNGDGGIEIATAGRRVQFFPIYEMISNIMTLCEKYGAYVNERCSIHIHLLASYLTPDFSGNDEGSNYIKNAVSELEHAVPEIIIANFHQLIRRYQCALVWLSASGDQRDKLTRWEKFRKSILPYSALKNRMSTLTMDVGGASKSKRKYALMNYEQMRFDSEGDVTRLHVEARYMDGNLCPSVVAAHTCLIYGLMLKAVEISRHGVLQSGNKDYMEKQKEMFNCLCNGDGDYTGSRHSDTRNIDPFIPALREQSKQLIRLVKNTLGEQHPADEILRSLAVEPLAFRRIKQETWKQIEDSFIQKVPRVENTLEDSMMQLIDLGAICECETAAEWIDTVTHQIATENGEGDDEAKTETLRNKIQLTIAAKENDRIVFWSQDIGGYLKGR